MSDFAVQSKLTRELVLAPYRQAAFGTAIPDAYLTRSQRFSGEAVPDYGTERRSDRGYSGKGYSFATNSQPIMQSMKISGIKSEATDWISLFVLANLMGNVVSTGAGPYTHVCTFDETTRTAIPTTVFMKDTADVASRYLDMMCTSATFTIGAKGSVGLEWDMLGTGLQTTGLLPVAPVVPVEEYLLGNDAVTTFGPIGAPVNMVGRFMNATLKLDNQGMVHEAPGGGLFGIFCRRSDPKFSLQATIAATDIDDVLVHFLSNDKCSFAIPIISAPNCQMTVLIPAANLKTTKMGFDGDMPIWNIDTDETTSYQNGSVPPISIEIVSSQPTMMTVVP